MYSKSIKGNEENYINPFGILFANSSNLYSLEGCKITGTSSDERDRYYIYQAFENFSDNASWEQIATIADEFYPSVSIGIPQKIMATNTLGFFPKEFGGSTSTYYGVTTYNMHWWQGLLTTSQAKKFGLTGRAGPTQHGDGNKMYCHIMYSQA